MRRLGSWPHHVVAAAWQFVCLTLLPRRVAFFYLRALVYAVMKRDYSSLCGATRPRELVPLLRAAGSRRRLVEIGTGTAWTTICLALANEEAQVVSYDIIPSLYRGPYLAMLDQAARGRIDLITRDGNDPAEPGVVDFVFVDASHECADTIRSFNVWKGLVAGDGVIAFHDYADPRWPGVTDAVRQLGLGGTAHGHLYVWTKGQPRLSA